MSARVARPVPGRFRCKPERLALLLICVAAAALGAAERPAILDAAKNADRSAVRSLVAQKADVNAADGDGTTALLWASYRDDLEIADLLLRAGAKVNAATDLGATPIWAAAQNGSSAMTKRLLDAGADPNAKLLLGETPLMTAARAGNAEVVRLLLAKGADPNARAARGQTALMWAVAQKHAAAVKALIDGGADLHARSSEWSQVMAVFPHGILDYNRAIPHGADTALLFAARVGDLASARHLVAAGANVNDADAWGVSALTLAAHSGFRDLAVFLLDRGADPNAARAGFTALHAAIMRRDEPLVRALLAHGADANAPLGTWTPTRRSSRDWSFAPALVGATPFWLAARFAQADVMRLLADHGANPRFVHRASYHAGDPAEPKQEVVSAAMAALGIGGPPAGDSAVAAWVRPARVESEAAVLDAIQLAVSLGADVNLPNTDGRTALDVAHRLKYAKVAAYLEERGGKPGTNTTGQSGSAAGR
jgi:ankyrin repeat protein